MSRSSELHWMVVGALTGVSNKREQDETDKGLGDVPLLARLVDRADEDVCRCDREGERWRQRHLEKEGGMCGARTDRRRSS